MLHDIFFLTVGLAILILGGEFLVRGASRIALRFHISSLVVGLTIVAFGTSSPELFISIKTAMAGSPDMTMGNVIGSNICNLALVLGLTAVFSPINVNENSIKIDFPVAMGSAIMLYLLVLNGVLQRWEGLIFVTILIGYIYFLIKKSRRDNLAVKREEEEQKVVDSEEQDKAALHWLLDILWIALGVVGLYFGSDWFVTGAQNIFLSLGADERLIGLVVLALGTSLPELVTSVVAALKNNTDLAIGNLMGSNIFNIFSILGITSIVKDIQVSEAIRSYDMLWMLGITLLLFPFMIINRKIGRIQGAIFLAIYSYYTYSIFNL